MILYWLLPCCHQFHEKNTEFARMVPYSNVCIREQNPEWFDMVPRWSKMTQNGNKQYKIIKKILAFIQSFLYCIVVYYTNLTKKTYLVLNSWVGCHLLFHNLLSLQSSFNIPCKMKNFFIINESQKFLQKSFGCIRIQNS